MVEERQKKYFVKKRHPESAQHTFYVDLLYKEIVRHTDKVEVYRTKSADVIFTNKAGEEIAVEVETGLMLTKKLKKKQHNEKFLEKKKQYGERCYIFLIKRALRNSFVRHGLPLLFRTQVKEFVKLHFSGMKNMHITQKIGSADSEIKFKNDKLGSAKGSAELEVK